MLHEVSRPAVLTLYRLAIGEAEHDTAVGEVLDSAGRGANRASLATLPADAQRGELLGAGDPNAMAACFLALLWAICSPACFWVSRARRRRPQPNGGPGMPLRHCCACIPR